jgi:crotonobetainyl-CoA:carnitine CoA-transferase CaiB-like acyl-CoA transferase
MLLIEANQDAVFKRLALAMEHEQLSEDPRYATHQARGDRQAEPDDLIANWSGGILRTSYGTRSTVSAFPPGRSTRSPTSPKTPSLALAE